MDVATIRDSNLKTAAHFDRRPRFVLNPTGVAPLSGVVSFATSRPTRADIQIREGSRTWTVATSPAFAHDHRHAIVGLRPNQDYVLTITTTDQDGQSIAAPAPLSFRTGPLPDDLPAIDVKRANPARMEPGLTLFGIRKSARHGPKTYGYLVAVDASGDVRWLRETGHIIGDVKRLRNGNIIYLTFDNRAIELNLLGEVVNQWYAAKRWPDIHAGTDAVPVDAEAFHHEIVELPNGNFLTLSVETRQLADFPSSETDLDAPGESALVVGDVAVEFRRNGTVVDSWSLFDVLDAYRIGYGSLGGYWQRKGIDNSCDWSHANSVILDPTDDSLILSVRHQDAVIKIDRATKSLKWILGTPDGWDTPHAEKLLAPKGDLEWQYHQHNAELTAAGTLLVFDNGNHRARPGQTPVPAHENRSRAVEFSIDEAAGTVTQLWSYGDDGPAHYAPFISGANELAETGNILVTFGGLLSDDDGKPAEDPATSAGWVRVVEVTHEADADVVFELVIDERDRGLGWDIYRSLRIPDFRS